MRISFDLSRAGGTARHANNDQDAAPSRVVFFAPFAGQQVDCICQFRALWLGGYIFRLVAGRVGVLIRLTGERSINAVFCRLNIGRKITQYKLLAQACSSLCLPLRLMRLHEAVDKLAACLLRL